MSSKEKISFNRPLMESPYPQNSLSAEDNDASPLSSNRLKLLYSTLLHCRLLCNKLDQLHHRRSTVRSAVDTGFESIIASCAMNLLPQDALLAPAAPFVAAFLKGVPLEALIAEFTSKRPAGKQAPNLGSAVDASTTFGIAAGMAAIFKLQHKPSVSLAIGRYYRQQRHSSWVPAVRFSGEHKLPVVFVFQSSSLSAHRRTGAGLDPAKEALATGVPGITADGDDPVAVSRVCQEAVRRAREGHGPSLINCRKLQDGLRSRTSVSRGQITNPLTFMEDYLRRKSLWSDEWKSQLTARFELQWNEAAKLAKQSKSLGSSDSRLGWIYSATRALNSE